jgi:predicted small metal-binding protein
MVTTNCQEIAGVNCKVPISGNSLDELKRNVFAHAQKDHKEMLAKMSPEDQAKIPKQIEAIYNKKVAAAGAAAS